MARSRFERLDAEKQEAILRVAADEFAERGYEAASLNRIIDRAGLSKGSMYYYFEDKADLFSTVVERATAVVLRLVGGFSVAELTAENFWATFERLLRRSAEYMEDHTWYVKLARSFYRLRGRPGGGKQTARLFDVARRWTAAILGRGQELGVVRRDLPLPFLVEATLAVGEVEDRWLLEHWDDLSAGQREGLVDADVDLLRRLLAPEPAS
jgi:AcrR family transcriptional regulator